MADVRLESCDYCDSDGNVEGDPHPTPDGPHYPTWKCTVCNGTHQVETLYSPITEEDVWEMA